MLVVTLTSWPKRIDNVVRVLDSIFRNTIQPNKIFLNLSVEEFPNKFADLPITLQLVSQANQAKLYINWIEGPNTKSFKKITPILKYLNDDDIIISADDDFSWPKDLIESRLIDFNVIHKRKHPVTPNKFNYSLHNPSGITYYMSPSSIFTKKMFAGWEAWYTEELISTQQDDRVNTYIMWHNGYAFATATKYTLKDLLNSRHNFSNNDPHRLSTVYAGLHYKTEQLLFNTYTDFTRPVPLVHIIHWYVKPRTSYKLTSIEIFHLRCLRHFCVSKMFASVTVSMVIDDTTDTKLTDFLASEFGKFTNYNDNVTFNVHQNTADDGEFVTYTKYVAPLIKQDNSTYVFYSHIKGVTKQTSIDILNEKYWSWVMYNFCFNNINAMQTAFNKHNNKLLYGGILQANGSCKHIIANWLNMDNSGVRALFNAASFSHYSGTFYWINVAKYALKLATYNVTVNDVLMPNIESSNKRTHITEFLLPGLCTNNELSAPDTNFNNLRSVCNSPMLSAYSNKLTYNNMYDTFNTFISKYNDAEDIAVVLITRFANVYINEWLKHHFDLGITTAYIYDNAHNDEQRVDIAIASNFKSRCIVIPYYNKTGVQVEAYNNAYASYGAYHDYMLFIDIDEFVVLQDTELTLPEYVAMMSSKHPTFECLRLNWDLYDDNDLIDRDMTIPVVEAFTRKASTARAKIDNHSTKSLVKTRCPNLEFKHPHYPINNTGADVVTINADGEIVDLAYQHKVTGLPAQCIIPAYSKAKLNHYMTKSLTEYVITKYRTKGIFSKRAYNLETFMLLNKYTKDKETRFHQITADITKRVANLHNV